MPTIISGQVGPQIINDGDQGVEFRQGRTAELCVSQTHGRYHEATSRGNVYTLSTYNINTGIAAGTVLPLSTGFTSAAAPLCGFVNPQTSGRYISLLIATYAISQTQAGAIVGGQPGYMTAGAGVTTTFAPSGTPINNLTLQPGGSVVNGYLGSSMVGNNATIFTFRRMGMPGVVQTAAPTSSINVNIGCIDYIDGSIIIPPGGFFGIGVVTNGSASINITASLTWEEVLI